LNRLADNAAASNNGWCVYLFHGIDNDGGYSPVSTATLQGCVDYMDKNRQKFWIESFGNVIRYIRERNAVSIEEIAATPDSITLRVSDMLDDSIFNYPLSIRRRLPEGWRDADVFQAGNRMVSGIRDSSGATYVIFDAVPDGGTVSISKNASGTGKHAYAVISPGNRTALRFTINAAPFALSVGTGPRVEISLFTSAGAMIERSTVYRHGCGNGVTTVPAFSTTPGMCIVRVGDDVSTVIRTCVVR
jgi:hypothetical protein